MKKTPHNQLIFSLMVFSIRFLKVPLFLYILGSRYTMHIEHGGMHLGMNYEEGGSKFLIVGGGSFGQ